MACDLVIDAWQVIGIVSNPDNICLQVPMKLPFFDMNRFPYVLVNNNGKDLYLINIKEKSIQTLVKARINRYNKICVEVDANSFDLHFMSDAIEEEDNKRYSY